MNSIVYQINTEGKNISGDIYSYWETDYGHIKLQQYVEFYLIDMLEVFYDTKHTSETILCLS